MKKVVKIWVEAEDGTIFDETHPKVVAYLKAFPAESLDSALKIICREYEKMTPEQRESEKAPLA